MVISKGGRGASGRDFCFLGVSTHSVSNGSGWICLGKEGIQKSSCAFHQAITRVRGEILGHAGGGVQRSVHRRKQGPIYCLASITKLFRDNV